MWKQTKPDVFSILPKITVLPERYADVEKVRKTTKELKFCYVLGCVTMRTFFDRHSTKFPPP